MSQVVVDLIVSGMQVPLTRLLIRIFISNAFCLSMKGACGELLISFGCAMAYIPSAVVVFVTFHPMFFGFFTAFFARPDFWVFNTTISSSESSDSESSPKSIASRDSESEESSSLDSAALLLLADEVHWIVLMIVSIGCLSLLKLYCYTLSADRLMQQSII